MRREQLIAEAVGELEHVFDSRLAELPERPLALSLLVYYDEADPRQLVPLCFALPADKIQWCVEHDRLDALWDQQDPEERMGEELEADDDDLPGPAGERLYEAMKQDADLLTEFFDAYTLALTRRHGVPVLVESYDDCVYIPMRDQLRARVSLERFAEWEHRDLLPRDRSADEALTHLDVLLSSRVDPDRVAGIVRGDRGQLWLTSSVSDHSAGLRVDQALHVDDGDPQVAGGLLPDGVVLVEVTDLRDTVHEAVTGGGAWMCVLPHPGYETTPPVRFIDEDGAEVVVASAQDDVGDHGGSWTSATVGSHLPSVSHVSDELDEIDEEMRAAAARANVPPVWPSQIPGPVRVVGFGSSGDEVTSVKLAGPRMQVETDGRGWGDGPAEVRDALLRHWPSVETPRERAQALLAAEPVEIAGKMKARRIVLRGLLAGDRWAVAWAGSETEIRVSAIGELPERLDFEPAEL